MKRYTIDFITWWYFNKVKNAGHDIVFKFYYHLNTTGAYPMFKNFSKPLYGDYSSLGKLVGMFIRFWWIVFGTFATGFFIIPKVLKFIFLLVLPLVPFIQLIRMI